MSTQGWKTELLGTEVSLLWLPLASRQLVGGRIWPLCGSWSQGGSFPSQESNAGAEGTFGTHSPAFSELLSFTHQPP